MDKHRNLFPLLTTIFLVALCSCDPEQFKQPYDEDLDVIDDEELDVVSSESDEDSELGEIDANEPETAEVSTDPLEADFNCDGRADLAVGVPFEDITVGLNTFEDAGAVHVIYAQSATSAGLRAPGNQFLNQTNDSIGATVPEDDDQFGWAVAAGYFNNDCYADLAVGAPGDTSSNLVDNAGTVTVFYGSPGGLVAGASTQLWDQTIIPDTVGDAAESGDKFGFALTTGDFGGTAQDDLAIGAPGEGIGAVPEGGAVNVLYGSSAPIGLTGVGTQIFFQGPLDGIAPAEPAEPFDHFGWALAAGDFNEAGRQDLAIGVPGEDLVGETEDDAGLVHVVYGDLSGLQIAATLVAPAPQIWHQGLIDGTREEGDEFGRALAAGDFDDDGPDDLAVGVPFEDVDPEDDGDLEDAGAVNVIYGVVGVGLTADDSQYWDPDTEGLRGSADDDDLFGWSLAAGNFNGDDGDDLAIGSPGEDFGDSREDAGAVAVLYGVEDDGLSVDETQRWSQNEQNVLDVAEEGDQFGYALSSGDFDGDGEDDLAIGIPFESIGVVADAGAVYVIYGGPGSEGLDDDSDQQLFRQGGSVTGGGTIADMPEPGDRFGWSVR